MPFVELHARSAFSFLRGASLPEELVRRAAELGQPAIAICDHMGFAGSARAHQTAKECGIRALVGTTLELDAPGTPFHLSHLPVLVASRPGYQALCQAITRHLHAAPPDAEDPTHPPALPKQRDTGPKARQTGNRTNAGGTPPLAPAASPFPWFPELADFPRGSLLALTGDREGPLAQALLRHDPQAALACARQLVATFGPDKVCIQLTRHGLRDETLLHRQLADLAHHLRLPLLATQAPLFASPARRPLADAFTCLRHHTTLDQAGALLQPNAKRSLATIDSIEKTYHDCPQALAKSLHLAEQLEFTLQDLGYRFPRARDPDTGRTLSPEQENRTLQANVFEGAKSRYPKLRKNERKQLDHELNMIFKLGFSGYFLIVHDLVRFARSRGILCQGRGSAANSAVCFALGITAVDPVASGLLFERFLSENRRSWPDIDIDFPSGPQRESAIQYLFESYAPYGAAMTANVITYRARSAFREMSKVLGFPPSLADRFSEQHHSPREGDSGWGPEPSGWGQGPSGWGILPQAVAGTSCPGSSSDSSSSLSRSSPFAPCGRPGSRDPDFSPLPPCSSLGASIAALVPPSHPRFGALVGLCEAVLTLPRHLGQHPGGMVICDRGLDSIIPLQPATMPGRTILQWDKDDCEDLGIVKVDLLGLGMLAAMEHTIRLCDRRACPVDLAAIPKDDPAVFELLGRADTVGTFQVESRAQMATLPVMRPRTFYDLAIEVAIIRPGPIVGDLVHPYLNRRNGREPVDFIHPSLEPVLRRTLGVPLFQEQVLRIAMTLAGFDGAEADELRRAMAFKRSDERMEKIAAKLHERMTARGIDPGVQQKVIRSIGSFALYGFPESHAISFALIAYASCWLKVHRPAEFYAGLVNHQPMGFYSVNTLLEDAKRQGLVVLPPSCVHSDWETTVPADRTLRLGLHRLKGLSSHTGERLLAERAREPFRDLPDLLRRARPNARERRLLGAAGALDDLPGVAHRRDALWQAELPLHDDLFDPPTARRAAGAPGTGQGRTDSGRPARGCIAELEPASLVSPLAPMSAAETLAADIAVTGASTGPHPMALWRHKGGTGGPPVLVPLPLCARDLHGPAHGTPVTVAGMVICRQRPGTAKGHCFISLEDETGIANLFVPRDTFRRLRLLISTERFLLARGRLQISEGGQPTVYVTDLARLPGIAPDLATASHDFH